LAAPRFRPVVPDSRGQVGLLAEDQPGQVDAITADIHQGTAGQIHFYGGSESAGYIDAMKFDANSLTGSWDRWYPTFRDGYFYEGATLQMAKHSCDPQPM